MAINKSNLILTKNDPTEGFIDYIQSIKPYHTKVLESLVEYFYKESLLVTVAENWNVSISTSRPDIETLTSCGFGTVWDSQTVAENYPLVRIIQAVGDIRVELKFLEDISNPSNILISYNPDLYDIKIGDPITIQTTGSFPNTTQGILSPGRIYYVVDKVNNTIKIALSPTSLPIIFVTSGEGVFNVHPENVKYNSFLVEPEQLPTLYDCIAVNTSSDRFVFINSYTITDVRTNLRQWIVDDILLSHAYQDITFGTQKQGSDSTQLANDITVYTAIVNIDGVPKNISIVGNTAQTFTELIAQINIDLSDSATCSLENGGIRITSLDIGENSNVDIVDINLFSALYQFSGILPSVNTSVAIANKNLFVHNNGSGTSNGKYTIASAFVSDDRTIITVKEQIPPSTQISGTLNIQDDFLLTPRWASGQKVKVNTTGVLPSPLSADVHYYFIPTDEFGVFTLSKTRLLTELSNRVNITDLGEGILQIYRSEMLFQGAAINVSGTYNNRNDNIYNIRSIEPEGQYLRVFVSQKVPSMTPSFISIDGIISLDPSFGGYDYPLNCEVLQAAELYTEAFIHERITFEFMLGFNDGINVIKQENINNQCGVNSFNYHTTTSHSILPSGIDTHFFDVGALDDMYIETDCP
ncbi:MAG: hypothetical protein ACXW2E_00800 [Nitrososphaeraceae archaeon]